ncbi:ribbon-helix-helix protein, CopG family [Acidiphilium acidophilum]|uniref:ribbon-helix-helix protein, CopG family n=1 Tax=Acidiphilium acidophilum TaxID=76588 RepID=UPI002E8E727A|nr:ribbon-helix-helix protein, CopG family [Acidiphilium acidophilum]
MSDSTQKTRPVSISLPPATLDRLDAAAADADIPRSTLVRHILDRSLARPCTNYAHAPWFETKHDNSLPARCTASLTPGVAGWTGPAMTWEANQSENSENFRRRIADELRAAGLFLAGAVVQVTEHPAWAVWGGRVPAEFR